MEEKNNKSYIYKDLAHVDYESGRYQTMKEHTENVSFYAETSCVLPELKPLISLIGILHDAGKLGRENQEDFHNILIQGDEVHKHGMDHSTAGGKLIKELIEEDWPVSEFISTVIYFHHGIGDCISLETGQSLQQQRSKKELDYEWIKQEFFELYNKELLEAKCRQAIQSYKNIYAKVNAFHKISMESKRKCGNGNFFMGMYFRVALSLLIDGDWTDTACFFQNIPLSKRISLEETQKIWYESILNFEKYMQGTIQNNPANGNLLNTFRQEISDSCRHAAETDQRLYRLTVPTGAGKTLSSLRFALYHAEKMKKQHIIYIAPFNSILEQNAEEIRRAIGNSSIVLEHHCNVICEEGEEERYRNLTETWDSPIIVTTAVQILNTLFSAQKSSIRRMHTLCNSIIIFDEVQAIPVKCMELFNLAVNFLSQFCNTTVVLCSATQPTLAPIQENNVCKCIEMSGSPEKYTEAFKRTDIMDATNLYPGSMEIKDLSAFVLERTEMYQSTLVIVNTTMCALKTFQQLKEICPEDYVLFHLSNNMCPEHKLDTLKAIKNVLRNPAKKVICVSTQVVEAGVNFSFGCVIRSKAGLDNVIQAAGRCNRHKELGRMGAVYIVQMSEKAENLNHLHEIRNAQAALQKVLEDFRLKPEIFKFALDSEEAIKAYYWNYYSQLRTNETKFPVDTYTTIIDLLGTNQTGRQQYGRANKDSQGNEEKIRTKLPQAFKTAGEAFEVISNDYKVNIVVPYNDEAKELLNELSQEYLELEEQKRILRKLQRYIIGISETRKENLNNAIYEICNGEVLVLCDGYYDKEVGVVDEPKMEFTNW